MRHLAAYRPLLLTPLKVWLSKAGRQVQFRKGPQRNEAIGVILSLSSLR